MRITDVIARASTRAKDVIAAPRRREAVSQLGTLVFGALIVVMLVVALNNRERGEN